MAIVSKFDFESIFLSKGSKTFDGLVVNESIEIRSSNALRNSDARTFTNCTFKRLDILGIQYQNELRFKNCRFFNDSDSLSLYIHAFELVNQGKLIFENCVFNKKCGFDNVNGSTSFGLGPITFFDCTFSDDLYFDKVNMINLTVSNSVFEKELQFFFFTNGKVNLEKNTAKEKVRFASECTLKEIILVGGNYYDIRLFTSSYEIFRMDNYRTAEGLESLNVEILNLSGLNIKSDTIIRNSTIEVLRINSVVNEGNFKLTDSSIVKKVEIIESNLGGMQIHNVSFNTTFLLENSFLGNCIFSNVKWPRDNKFSTAFELEKGYRDLRNKRILRESYRQLKEIYKRQSNHIEALKFYRNEMDLHWDIIRSNDEGQERWKFIQDYIIVGTSRLFSDFGQSFFRPIGWLLGVHLLLFLFLAGIFDYHDIRLAGSFDINKLCEGIGHYFNLLNPAHKYMENVHGGALFIDFFMRLFSSYFIFHIIRASRKYGKL